MNKDIEARNISMLTEHFLNGCKQNCIQKLGLEVEHFLIEKTSGRSVTYYEPHGTEWLLQQLQPYFPAAEEHNGHLLGFHNNDYSISLEPAAQIEISIAPRENPAAIRQIYLSFRELLRPFLEQQGYELVTAGYQPVSRVNDLPLIPKERYAFMDRYFQTVDTRGRNMMRGTASAQISVDYTSEREFVSKIRCAYLLMPAIKLLTDNTGVFENKPWNNWLCRTEIWNHVDSARCGIIPGLFEPDFGFKKYCIGCVLYAHFRSRRQSAARIYIQYISQDGLCSGCAAVMDDAGGRSGLWRMEIQQTDDRTLFLRFRSGAEIRLGDRSCGCRVAALRHSFCGERRCAERYGYDGNPSVSERDSGRTVCVLRFSDDVLQSGLCYDGADEERVGGTEGFMNQHTTPKVTYL